MNPGRSPTCSRTVSPGQEGSGLLRHLAEIRFEPMDSVRERPAVDRTTPAHLPGGESYGAAEEATKGN